MESYEIIVVGAGAAGLATAALLQREDLRPLVLEAGPEPGAAWRSRYDRLRLHTPRLLSGLPGLRIPRRYGRWVGRDDLIEYLRDYAAVHDIDIRCDTRVERLEPQWTLETSDGPISAEHVVVATGYNGAPYMPDWPGRDGFTGELRHSSEYRNPEPYRGPDVLLSDGSRIRPDAVIAATGFRAGLDALVGHLGVLGPHGLPQKTDGEPALPGLWFVGFTPTLGGQLREGSIAARKVAAALAAELRGRVQPVGGVDDDADGVAQADVAQ